MDRDYYVQMSNGQLTIYDTTLRDGAQGEGVHFSLSDKLRLAEKLAAFGIHYVEGGWPGSNDKDREFFPEAKKLNWGPCKLAAFGSTRRAGVQASTDPQVKLLLEAETPVVTIFGKSWLLHVEKVLHHSGGKCGHDPRYRRFSEKGRPGGHLRRRALF